MTSAGTSSDRLGVQPDTTLFGPPPGRGRPVFALIALIHLLLALLHAAQVGASVPALVATAGLIAASGAALLPAAQAEGFRLPARWGWAASAGVALTQLATIWDAQVQPGDYAPWYLRGATIVCAVVILRGRAGSAWLGAGAAFAVIAILGVLADAPTVAWLILLLRQVAVLGAIQVFAFMLDRSRQAIVAMRAEERARLATIQRRQALTRQYRVEAERIRSLVTPTLQRIAAGERSAGLRDEARLLEGTLRDSLRGRLLAAGPVQRAARAARARGVDVALLDDLGDTDRAAPVLPEAALAWVAERLATAEPPRATARVAADSDGRVAVSFYAEASGGSPEFLTIPHVKSR